MEKLLQLLNEYTKEIGFGRTYLMFNYKSGYFGSDDYQRDHCSFIISKKFGFIQWLVVNDKIKRKIKLVIKYFRCNDYGELRDEDRYNEVESLLMRLAISDDPIEFLVSLLR